jgi:hypothetical protein
MSLMDPRGQANPSEESDVAAEELKAKVARTVAVLDINAKAIHRWFWKILLALTLLAWTLTLPIAFLKWVP